MGRNFRLITYFLPLSPPSTLVCTANTPIPVLHTLHNTPHQYTFYTTPSIVLIGPIVSPIPSRSAALTPSKQSLRVYFHPYHTTLVFDIHRILVLRSTTSPFYVEHSLSFTVFTVVTTPTNQPTTSDWSCPYPLVTRSHNSTLSTSTPQSQPLQYTTNCSILPHSQLHFSPCDRYDHRLDLVLS